MQDNDDGRMPIMAHLEELRKRILYSVIAVAVGFCVSFEFSERLLAWMQIPLTMTVRFAARAPYIITSRVPSPARLIFIEPTEAFWMYMKIAAVAGVFLALPFILAQVWLFVAPGLRPRERRYALPFVLSATAMFVLGALFCQYLVLPMAIRFLLTFQTENLTPMISVGRYVDFCSKFLLAFGVIFELPLIITLLSRLGVVTPRFLSKNRKYAVLLAFIVAAILTPTPDAFNMSIMAAAILLLYEAGIVMARIIGRKREPPAPA